MAKIKTKKLKDRALESPLELYDQLMKSLNDYDERALVLSLGSFAEQSLGLLLMHFLKEGSEDLVEGFESPLGSFGIRIKACFALGLIDKHQRKDFQILQEVRNYFAHNWENPTFSHPDVANQLRQLSGDHLGTPLGFPNTEEGGRNALLGSIAVRCLELQLRIQRLKHGHEPRIEDNWYHLGGTFPKDTGSTEEKGD